jgi:hypothetical protein
MGAIKEPARSGGSRKVAGKGSTRAQSSSRPADNPKGAGGKNPPVSPKVHSAGARKTAGTGPARAASKKPLEQKELDRCIKECRAALHGAIQRAGDKPLSECPEVLRLSKELDGLIDQVQKKG